jgi:hypothetical protein
MLSDLKQAHQELLGHIAELEAILAESTILASEVARVRLKLSKASTRRRKIVVEAIQRVSGGATVEEARRLSLLRDNDAAIVAATSHHVGEWTIEAILANGEGYRDASSTMRKSMLERIATEKRFLYPLLERAAPDCA